MTIKEAAQQALEIQDASNLSGIANSFPEVIKAIWKEANRLGKGTVWVNNHPICKLFIDKMDSLAEISAFHGYGKAYDYVKELAKS